MTDRRRTALLALGLYALAAFALQLRLPGATLYGDEHEYVYLGGRLAAGRGYTFGPSAAGLVPGGSFDTPGRGSWYTPPDPAEPGPSVPTAWRQPGVPAVLARGGGIAADVIWVHASVGAISDGVQPHRVLPRVTSM